MSSSDPPPRRSLFRKYFIALLAAAVVPLAIGGGAEAWFGVADRKALLDERLKAEAGAAAERIDAVLSGIAEQLGWVTHVPWTASEAEARRVDALRVLRQAPDIVEIALIDGGGTERLRVSRIGRDISGAETDRGGDPAFLGARAKRVWFGPVTLNRGSEPYMRVAVAGNRKAAGVAVAEVNLKFVSDEVAKARIGERGVAFAVDEEGRLVAHPEIERVLRGERPALQRLVEGEDGADAFDADRREMLMAQAVAQSPRWTVVAAEPASEAYAPIRAALLRAGVLIAAGGALAAVLAALLARRMARPIRRLEEGARRIGDGEFGHRIPTEGGDELERLARSFNAMAGELAVSQARSERIARLRRFLSPQVAEIVEGAAAETMLDPRRADVAVVFCDLRGFTAFAALAEADEVMRVVAEYYAAVGDCVARRDATLTHFAGDGVMMLVNAPVASPGEPATRAARLAIDIAASLGERTSDWRGRGHRIGFGIGLARGAATVGVVGYEGRQDYTAIGPVVNLAARLCASATDGEILADAATAALVDDPTIGFRALGRREVRGLDHPVEVASLHAHPLEIETARTTKPEY